MDGLALKVQVSLTLELGQLQYLLQPWFEPETSTFMNLSVYSYAYTATSNRNVQKFNGLIHACFSCLYVSGRRPRRAKDARGDDSGSFRACASWLKAAKAVWEVFSSFLGFRTQNTND